MSVKIKVPNKFYNGTVAGVTFKDGVALFEDEKLGKEIAGRFGYEVIAVEVIAVEVIEPEVEPEKEPVKPKNVKKSAKKAVNKEAK